MPLPHPPTDGLANWHSNQRADSALSSVAASKPGYWMSWRPSTRRVFMVPIGPDGHDVSLVVTAISWQRDWCVLVSPVDKELPITPTAAWWTFHRCYRKRLLQYCSIGSRACLNNNVGGTRWCVNAHHRGRLAYSLFSSGTSGAGAQTMITWSVQCLLVTTSRAAGAARQATL